MCVQGASERARERERERGPGDDVCRPTDRLTNTNLVVVQGTCRDRHLTRGIHRLWEDSTARSTKYNKIVIRNTTTTNTTKNYTKYALFVSIADAIEFTFESEVSKSGCDRQGTRKSTTKRTNMLVCDKTGPVERNMDTPNRRLSTFLPALVNTATFRG